MDQTGVLLNHDIVKQELVVMPIFQQYLHSYKEEKPFMGVKIGFSHVLAPNTVMMIATLLNGGADLDIITNNGLTHNQTVLNILEDAGLNVIEDHPDDASYDYVIDCGGYFTKYPPNIGAVEVTKTGIHKYVKLNDPSYTLIDIDSTKTKLLETFLGNPEGVHLTLKHFLDDADEFLQDADIAIIGFGKIGRGMARKFRDVANLLIVDISDKSLQMAESLGFKTYKISKDQKTNSLRLSGMDLIVTATGHEGTMTYYFQKSQLKDTMKINLGAVDEWGDDYDDSEIFHSKSKPFNFNLSPPTPSKYIDPILALQVDGLKYLISKESKLGQSKHVIPDEFDDFMVDLFNTIYQNEAEILYRYFNFDN